MNRWMNLRRAFKYRVQAIVGRNLPWMFTILVFIGWASLMRLGSYANYEDTKLGGPSLNSQLPAKIVGHPKFSSKKLAPAHLKSILLWNSWYRTDSIYSFGTGHQPFIDAKCPVSDCFISNNLYAMPPSQYDAILFFLPMLVYVPFTYTRKSNQLYVFVTDHVPYEQTNGARFAAFNEFFNLTMTYRLDSDIVWPQGSIDRPNPGMNEPSRINYAEGKTKLVAWFVSDCDTISFRESYVSILQKYIDVDIYGPCGNKSSHQCTERGDSCYDLFERDYKFYLSFEHSFCRDYVTEEFFEILDRRMVPIVYGAANYSSLAPPGSYIDATQFGARRLAELLVKIDRDDELYNQYFRWKSEGL